MGNLRKETYMEDLNVTDGCNENTLIRALNQSMYGSVVSQVLIALIPTSHGMLTDLAYISVCRC